MLGDQIDAISTSAERLGKRGTGVPVEELVLHRMLVAIGRSLNQRAEDVIRPFGVAEPEFRVLVELYAKPDHAAHPGELCAGATQSPTGMTRTTDALVARGLISREASADDRRRLVLRVTAAGEKLLRRMLPAVCASLRSLFAPCPPDAQRRLAAQLRELAAALDEAERHRTPGGAR